MDRRDFIKYSVIGAGAMAAGAALGSSAEKTDTHIDEDPDGYVREPARKIPVMASADIVVVGGGPAGFSAALSAARQGADVLLIEKNWYLGGLWTGGLVLPVLALYGRNGEKHADKAVKGLCDEVCDRLAAMGMTYTASKQGACPVADPEATKYVLAEMLAEAGVRVLYNSSVCAVKMSCGKVSSLILETKSGRFAVNCKAVVDCSGDGDIIEWSGEEFELFNYHVGAMSRVGGTDRINRNAPGFEEVKIGSQTPIEGVVLMHRRGVNNNGLDAFQMSKVQHDMRKEMFETVQEIKKKPGYENINLLETSPMLGVRVTRVLKSMHHLTVDESMNYTAFDDCIGMAGFCDRFVYNGQKVSLKTRPVWQIPYRSLIPRKCPNLIVAGRCFDFDEVLAYDAREIGTCFVTGQAAGTAAAIACTSRTSMQEVDISRLQATLRNAGARLDF